MVRAASRGTLLQTVKLRLSDCITEQAYMLNPSWTHTHLQTTGHHVLLSSLPGLSPAHSVHKALLQLEYSVFSYSQHLSGAQ